MSDVREPLTKRDLADVAALTVTRHRLPAPVLVNELHAVVRLSIRWLPVLPVNELHGTAIHPREARVMSCSRQADPVVIVAVSANKMAALLFQR